MVMQTPGATSVSAWSEASVALEACGDVVGSATQGRLTERPFSVVVAERSRSQDLVYVVVALGAGQSGREFCSGI